jgi:Xaa-Pro aminopeptidase
MIECINNFQKFKTEKDVEKFLHMQTINRGCTLAFPPIVASGIAGAIPHYEPIEVNLRKGFCVIDFGVCYNGYNSDITRTIYLGNPTKKEIAFYNLLLKIQNALINSVRLNEKCESLHEQALRLLEVYAKNFNHGLGHGLGLQIHELPDLKPLSKDTFKNSMVFTIEPGIYFENKFGIRIEDDIHINKGRTEILTHVPKKLIIKK